MFILLFGFAAATFAPFTLTNAVPVSRELSATSINDLVDTAFQAYLASQNVIGQNISVIPSSSPKLIRLLTNGTQNKDQVVENNRAISDADIVGQNHFSNAYIKFRLAIATLNSSGNSTFDTSMSAPSVSASVAPYTLPAIQSTLEGWSSGVGLSSFQYDSTSSATAVNSLTLSLSLGSAALLDVSPGAWFDDFKSADLLRAGNGGTAAKLVFGESFGTAESPGPAAAYNAKALVVWKPSFKIHFPSNDDYTSFQSSLSSTCYSVICLAQQSVESMTSEATTDVSYQYDLGDTAFIIGYLREGYWDTRK